MASRKKIMPWLLGVLVVALVAIHWQRVNEAREFQPVTVIPRPFPAITKVPLINAEAADELLRPEELVLGVQINGEARAYPINMLTGPRREIINDQLGGQAIAATW